MSLRKVSKERLLWAIRQVVIPFGRIVLITDHNSLRVVSSCCSLSEILDEGVHLIELVTKKRQPIRKNTALYLLSDDLSSLDTLLDDFDPGHEVYKDAFIMFNYHLPNDGPLRTISESVDIEKVLCCVELHLNFVTYEDHVFHGNMGLTLPSLYPKYSTSIVHKISSRIASLCSTLKAWPEIRYHNCKHKITGHIADSVASLLRVTQSQDFKESADSSRDILIIFDRCIDPSPLFIHEYTYQAFAYDVLNIPCCSKYGDEQMDDTWKFSFVTNSGNVEQKTAVLSTETDVLWEKYRHMHIQKVNKIVLEEVQQFTKDKKLTNNLNRKVSAGPDEDKNFKSDNALNVVRSLPQVQYLLEKYWAHVTMSEKCFELIGKKNLLKVGEMEQALATNLDKSGKHLNHSKISQHLSNLLCDAELEDEQKIRLLLLYFSNYRNLGQAEVETMISEAKLIGGGRKIIDDFLKFGIGSTDISKLRANQESSSSTKITHRIDSKSDASSFYKKHIDSSEYDLSRYVPEIRHVILRAIKNTLDEKKFPKTYITESQRTARQADESSGDEMWVFGEDRGTEGHSTKPKLIIYIVGGVAFSEMREVYSIAKETSFQLYIGGDTIIVPSRIIEGMWDTYLQTGSSKS